MEATFSSHFDCLTLHDLLDATKKDLYHVLVNTHIKINVQVPIQINVYTFFCKSNIVKNCRNSLRHNPTTSHYLSFCKLISGFNPFKTEAVII